MNLFSAKKIVLTCSFLFIIMFYFTGGLDDISTIEMPSTALPEFGISFDSNEPIGKINTEPKGMSAQCQKAYNLGPNKWYFANCT